MYAVIQTGGKQYKVKKGDTLAIELLHEDPGAARSFNEVLLVGEGANVKIGTPFVDKAEVKTEVIAVGRGPKIDILRRKRRKQFKRHVGHRQPFSRILVTEVSDGSSKDTLSAKEKEEIIKRVGFPLGDTREAKPTDEQKQERKQARVKARAEKRSAKTAEAKRSKGAAPKKAKTSAKKKTTKKKASAKKAAPRKAAAKKTAKKAPAKKAAAKSEKKDS